MNRRIETKTRPLAGGRALAGNTLWNLFGQGTPMLVAIFTIPVLVRYLGTDRFGVLNLAWMTIGYFTMFDLGLGRALTKLVAEKLGGGDEGELPALIWTASVMMAVFGVVGAIATWLISPMLVTQLFKVPEAIREETLYTFYLLAASIPVIISTSGLRGILEAMQRFDLVNAVRVPMGIFTFAGPLLVLPFTNNLLWVTAVLVLGRCIAWGIHLLLCFRVIPALRRSIVVRRSMLQPLLGFGGWMMVSNVISPLLVYLDRFLIGVLVSVTAVAYYATPWEVVTKFLIVPSALVGVLFPAFSAAFSRDLPGAALIYRRGQKYVFLSLFPVTLLAVTFAREGLMFWLGPEFAENGFRVMQLLAIGVLVNAMAMIPFAFVQGAGRPDITAKLHFLEALVYLPCLWLLTVRYGIVGTTVAWLLRVCADTLMLMLFVDRLVTERGNRLKVSATGFLLSTASLAAAMLLLPMVLRMALFVITSAGFALISWFYIIDTDERSAVMSRIGACIR
jgi:O-antigen/teichoic acid export membrane protein